MHCNLNSSYNAVSVCSQEVEVGSGVDAVIILTSGRTFLSSL